jgi:lariat debranching enzyme
MTLFQVIDFPSQKLSSAQSSPKLTFDPEWLAITRSFHPFFSTIRTQPPFPEESQAREMVKMDLDWVQRNVRNRKCDGMSGIRDVADCQAFAMTAPGPGNEGNSKFVQREPSIRSHPPYVVLNGTLISTDVFKSANRSILRHA